MPPTHVRLSRYSEFFDDRHRRFHSVAPSRLRNVRSARSEAGTDGGEDDDEGSKAADRSASSVPRRCLPVLPDGADRSDIETVLAIFLG